MRNNTKLINNCFLKIHFIIVLCLLIFSCSHDNSRTIDTLKISVLPDQKKSQLRTRYQPLVDYIQEQTGIPCTLKIPENYSQLINWFEKKQIDMALFGGVTYVKAHKFNGAIALVMRDIDTKFKSAAIVQTTNPAKNLNDLKGSSLAFGSRLSTSGHFMPRYFFQRQKIIPEKYFSKIQYSGAHDTTALWVQAGKVDVGVANDTIIKKMFIDKRLDKKKVKVIWESPFYADYVWAIQGNINKKQVTSIRNAFLRLSQGGNNKSLLKSLGANYYIPASHNDFKNLQKILKHVDQL